MLAADELREYRAFSHVLNKMMFLVGLWPAVKPNLFYRWLPALTFSTCLVASFVIFNFVWAHHSHIEVMTKGMGLAGSFINTMLKILCIVVNRKDVNDLHETLDGMFDELLIDESIQSLILKKITTLRQLSTTLSFLIFLSILTYCLTPMVNIIHQYIQHIHPITYSLMLPAIYPWPISNGGFMYFCHFAFEIFSGYTLFFVTCSVDSMFPIYICQMAGQLTCMSHQLIGLKDGDNHDVAIRECARKYRILLRCRDNMEIIYGPIILWMQLTSAIVLCALTFQLSKMDTFSIGHICLFIAYMGSKMLQTFIYAWSGSILTSESEMFADALYACDWPGTGRKRFMTSILIMLTQRPLVITACNYFVVSIDMFAMILNTTVSYFFLLKTMEDKLD